MKNKSDELNENELEKKIKLLTREKAPPQLLEERVVERLKETDLINSRPARKMWSFLQPAAVFTASLLIFIWGAAVGALWPSTFSPLQPEDHSPQFMLLLFAAEQTQETPPDEVIRRVREYSAWAAENRQKGFLLEGEKLKVEKRILSISEGALNILITETGQPNSALQGYFVIKAKDYEQAVAVAQSCPHLKYGGHIEVKEIERF